LEFSENTRITTQVEPIAFRIAFVQSSPGEMLRGAIQHLTLADSSFPQIASAIFSSLRA
jgi:hypothetical protein